MDENVDLTDDHLRVLLLFAHGRSAFEVAQSLDLSLAELGEQMIAVREVLGVDSTAAAVQHVRQRGLI